MDIVEFPETFVPEEVKAMFDDSAIDYAVEQFRQVLESGRSKIDEGYLRTPKNFTVPFRMILTPGKHDGEIDIRIRTVITPEKVDIEAKGTFGGKQMKIGEAK